MKEEIASKITEEFPKILTAIVKNLNNPLSSIIIENHKNSLALAIHTIWTNHNLRLIKEKQQNINIEKVYEVLDVFAKELPLLNDVKALIMK